MAKRWQRGRKERPESEPSRAESEDPAPEPDAAADDDLATRLDAVTSRFDRPPTADELRAAFRRKTDDRGDEPPEPKSEFESRYSTESLFVATPVEDLPPMEEPSVDDRSRTKGDYYYDPEDAWGVLGLRPGASWKEIAAAHRRLAMRHHPDRLLGATAEERAASEETMREVNVAYSVLRRLTGH